MSWLSNFLTRKYVKRFSRVELQKRNHKYILRALSAYGYNNSENMKSGGETFFVERILTHLNPRVAFDVGANVGNYSRMLLKALPDAEVHAFEPLQEPFAKLSELSVEFDGRSIPINLGVGNRVQDLEIHYNPEASSHALFSTEVAAVPYLANENTRTIPVTTLDSYCNDRLGKAKVDFIKIDTEGFEAEVLQGAKQLLENHRPMAVQIEFNWHHMFRSHSLYYLASFLPEYEVFQLIPGGMSRRDAKDPLSNLFMFSNFVFLRKDLVQPLEQAGFRF